MKRPPCPELEKFLDGYPPNVRKIFKATRAEVFKVAPTCNEMVYDAYSAVASGYTFTCRFSEAFCHIAAYSNHVNLGFNHGAELNDAEGLLQGSGKRIRHLTLRKSSDLQAAHVRRFLKLAVEQGRRLADGQATPKLKDVIVKRTAGVKRRPAAKVTPDGH